MDNLQPVSNLNPSDLPEGFSMADPNAGAGSQTAGKAAAAGDTDQKQAVLEQALTPEALARLRRIKLVKPQKAASLENAIANMAMTGKLPGRINEGKLIEMLERGNAKQARAMSGAGSISIQRKKYALDSDDEDDDDDDLLY